MVSIFFIYIYKCTLVYSIKISIPDRGAYCFCTQHIAMPFAKRCDKLFIHNNGRQERIHVSAACNSRLASYSAADPRNDFSVCRAGTRTRKPYADRTARLCAARSLTCISFRINYRSYVDCRRTMPAIRCMGVSQSATVVRPMRRKPAGFRVLRDYVENKSFTRVQGNQLQQVCFERK